MKPERKATVYMREPELQPPGPLLYDEGKWTRFVEALSTEADAIIVAFPEVLGDSYDELTINLGKVSLAGKSLIVAGPSAIITRA